VKRIRSDLFLFLLAFLMDFCTGLISFAVPLKAIEMGATALELGLIGTASMLNFSIACTFTGKLADKYNRQYLMAMASGMMVITFCLIFVATNYWLLLIGAALGWGLLALFWPSLQATLAENRSRPQLVRTLSTFNIFWTIGFMLGPLTGGYLYLIAPSFLFGTAIVGMGILAVIIFSFRYSAAIIPDRNYIDPKVHTQFEIKKFRWIAWTASFSAFFIMGTLNNQFPKLAEFLSIQPDLLGLLLAIPRFIQMIVMFLVRYSLWWQFRLRPLIIPQFAAIIGMILLATQDSPFILGIAFGTVGLLVGSAFAASQFYSFFQEKQKGEKGARNEMIIGIGQLSAPLAGGFVAELIGLRMPYILCTIIVIAGILVEYRWYKKPGKVSTD